MNCEIIPINENSWRIEDSGVRCFLLTGSEKALLIDSGRELHTARDIAESLTDLPVNRCGFPAPCFSCNQPQHAF